MKVYLDTIGCRLNQSEIEAFARQFRALGHTIVGSPDEADTIVVNTCAVTSQAASDSRQKIRQSARALGRHSSSGKMIVTGCWASLDPAAARSMPGVTGVVSNLEKDHLVADLLGVPIESFDLEPVAREPLPGLHLRTRAFIKVQDGCDNHCTFCVTRIARGPSRSRTISQVLDDVHAALEGGAQELVLTGVHLGSWGQDFETPVRLSHLIETLLHQPGLLRLRLSSLEPWDLEEDFFSLWSDPRLCRHLHLPLQSGSADILKRMARKTTPASFARLVEAARKVIPDMAVTTDVIVGFPGETDQHFAESLEYVRQMEFAQGHIFTYSARPGTVAARMPDQVPSKIRKLRNAVMRTVIMESSARYRARFINSELDVLWESTSSLGPQGWLLHGLTDNYLPVIAHSPEKKWNQISRVRLLKESSGEIEGLIL